MTVASNISKHTYYGNGVTTLFPFSFTIFKESDIKVILTDLNGKETQLTSGWLVDVSQSAVVYPYPSGQPLPAGWRITLLRLLDIVQETSLPNQGPYFAETVEKAADRSIAIDQQQQEQLERVLKLGVSAGEDVSRDLPVPVPKGVLRWNSTGTALENTPSEEDILAKAEALALQDYTGTMQIADVISKGPWLDVRAFGVTGDGVTNDAPAMQELINNASPGSTIMFPNLKYVAPKLYLRSDIEYVGIGGAEIIGNVHIVGAVDSSITYSAITPSTIVTNDLQAGDLVYIYKYGYNREMNLITSVDGNTCYLFNNLLFNIDTTYTIEKISPVSDVKISNLAIEAITIDYALMITLDEVKVKSLTIGRSMLISSKKLDMNPGAEQRLDIMRATRNVAIEKLVVSGGDTISDNGAIKINEGHYVTINTILSGTPMSGGLGYFHSVMIDGCFAEDGFPQNPSKFVLVNNFQGRNTNAYYNIFVAVSEDVSLLNCYSSNTNIKTSKNVRLSGRHEIVNMEGASVNTRFRDGYIDTLRGTITDFHASDTTINMVLISGGSSDSSFNICKINAINTTIVDIDQVKRFMYDSCIFPYGLNADAHTDSQFNGFIVSDNIHISAVRRCIFNGILLHNTSTIGIWLQNCTNIQGNISLSPGFTISVHDGSGVVQPIQLHIQNYGVNGFSNKLFSYWKDITAPTTGTHTVGEIVYSSAPVAGGYLGWVCVVSGSPGIWKGFGLIQS